MVDDINSETSSRIFPITTDSHIMREVMRPGHVRLWLVTRLTCARLPGGVYEMSNVFFSGPESHAHDILQSALSASASNNG